MSAVRRVLVIGIAWTVLWLAFWAIVLGIIGVVAPDNIDPGEGPLAMAAVLGPMGFLSGIAFGALLWIGRRGRPGVDLSGLRAAGYGILGSAIAQLPYLGHGDQGLPANLVMALLFCAVGGGIAMVWLSMVWGWSRFRSARPASS